MSGLSLHVDLQNRLDLAVEWVLTSGLRIVVIVLSMSILIKVAHVIVGRFFRLLKHHKDTEFQKRTDTLSSIVRWLISIGILAIMTVMVMGELGIEIGPILAAAGVVGLAVGFGAQNLVQDVISGFFILIEDQIRVGDVVDIGGKNGLVERITLRVIELRDVSGNVHYIRNGQINVITNMTKEYSRYVFDIAVAYHEDVDNVMNVIREVDAQLRANREFSVDILEPIELLGVDRFADSAVVIKARIKTKPSQQWRIGREFNRLLKQAFDEHGIVMPFPQVTVNYNPEPQAAPDAQKARGASGDTPIG